MTVQNTTSQIQVRSGRGFTPHCGKHVQIDIGHYQQGLLCKSIMGLIIDIHAHRHIYQGNNAKMGNTGTFHIHVKREHGFSSTQNTFSVLLVSVCAVTAVITICDKSQKAAARIPDLSQFVTMAICDGSKYNFSD